MPQSEPVEGADALDTSTNAATQAHSAVQGSMDGAIATLSNQTASIVRQITQLPDLISQASSIATSATTTAITEHIDRAIAGVQQILVTLPESLDRGLVRLDASLERTLEGVRSAVVAGTDATTSGLRDFSGQLRDYLRSLSDAHLDAVRTESAQLGEAIKASIGATIAATETQLEGVTSALLSQSTSELFRLTSVLQATGQGQTDATAKLTEQVAAGNNQIGVIFGGQAQGTDADALIAWLKDLIPSIDTDFPLLWRLLNTPLGNTLVKSLLDAGMLASTAFGLISAYGEPLVERVKQRQAEQFANVLLPIETLIRGYWGGGLTPQRVYDQGAKAGVSADNLTTILEQGRATLSPQELAVLLQRELISPEEFEATLKLQGYDDVARQELRDSVTFQFSPSDFVTFAQRNVYEPDIIKAFGLDQDILPDFVADAKKVGISSELAMRYWIAHWQLPSTDQGIVMRQRGLLDDAQLEQLMTANELHPFWHDRMRGLTYNPINRIDIRRMLIAGLIDESEVVTDYEHIGYSPSDAQLQAKLAVHLRDASQRERHTASRKLSEGLIVQLYEMRVIDTATASRMLHDSGYDADEAQLLISLADTRQEIRVIEREKHIIEERYRHGAITYNEAVDELNRLALNTPEAKQWLDELDASKRIKVFEPTASELHAWLMAGIIDIHRYADALERIGWTEPWLSYQVEIAEQQLSAQVAPKPPKKSKAPPRAREPRRK